MDGGSEPFEDIRIKTSNILYVTYRCSNFDLSEKFKSVYPILFSVSMIYESSSQMNKASISECLLDHEFLCLLHFFGL